MDKFVQTELEGAGVNVEETLRRFMNNEMLMIKFLRKFVDDESMKIWTGCSLRLKQIILKS